MQIASKIVPCLWFDHQAEEAARFYVEVFPDGRITATSHYSEAGKEIHGRPPGSVLTVAFEVAGQSFTALNGGPQPFRFNEALSLQVMCDDQREVDHYWQALGAGGEPGVCGWLKDRYGVSWQVVPRIVPALITDPDAAKCERVLAAIMGMRKPDIAALQRAHAGP